MLPAGYAVGRYAALVMSKTKFKFEENIVSINDQTWTVDYPIIDAKIKDDRVFLIFDQMAGPSWRQFQNLKAFDLEGNELWTAQHPTSTTSDYYVDFKDEGENGSLIVWNFACYICEIDPETGKLINSTFTK